VGIRTEKGLAPGEKPFRPGPGALDLPVLERALRALNVEPFGRNDQAAPGLLQPTGDMLGGVSALVYHKPEQRSADVFAVDPRVEGGYMLAVKGIAGQ